VSNAARRRLFPYLPQVGAEKAAAVAAAAHLGARFPALASVTLALPALDGLSDAQAAGMAEGLASAAALSALRVEAAADGAPPLGRPAAVAAHLSLLLPRLTGLRSLHLGLAGLAEPVRPGALALPLLPLRPPLLLCDSRFPLCCRCWLL